MPTADKLHPGLHVALARGRMDEAQIARAMAAGEMTSPQKYGNAWLFNVRITGTGSAYRRSLDEYVWRDPELYMNQGFLDRCNGLPVILEHPKAQMLDSREFAQRIIGSILYPYLKEEEKEVWGIARILDMPAADYMREHQLSTSPAVVFRNPDIINEKIKVGDGKHLLIEGRPSLVDHLAICEEGVWDKGGPPAGVDLTGEKESTMADTQNRTARQEEGDKLDRVLASILSIGDRLGKMEDRVYGDSAGRRDASEDEAEQAAEMRELVEDLSELAEEEEQEAEEQMHQEADAKRDKKDRKDEAPSGKDSTFARLDEDEDEDKEKKADARKDEDEDEDKDKSEDKSDKKADARKDEDEDEDKEKSEDKSDRKDTAKRDDARKDEDEDEMADARKDSALLEKVARKRGESDSAYARRADSAAKADGITKYRKRSDESIAAYCDRMGSAVRRDRARLDAVRRLNRVDVLADAVVKVAGRLDKLKARLDAQDSEEEPADASAFAEAQSRADEAYMALGDSAPRPLRGEGIMAYRTRLLRKLQPHSAAWKDTDLSIFAKDAAALGNVENLIYADAMKAAMQPQGVEPGTLREIKKRRQGGGEITEFVGQPLSWMQSFMAPARATRRLRPMPAA